MLRPVIAFVHRLGWIGSSALMLSTTSMLLLAGLTWPHTLQPHPLGYRIDGAGDTVLVTHGGLASKETMLAYAYAAADGGHAVVLADLPAHGSSGLPAGPSISQSTREWKRLATAEQVTLAIGHSLGSTYLCPSARIHVTFPRSVHIGRDEKCGGKGRRNLEGDSFRLAIPRLGSYHLDHFLEPWNPGLVAEATGAPLDPLVVSYAVLPWSAFFFGMIAAVMVQRGLVSPFLRDRVHPLLSGGVSALVLGVAFALLTWRRLWYPLPSLHSDLDIALQVALPTLVACWVLHRWIRGPWHNLVASLGITGWALAIGLVLARTWGNEWPGAGVIEFYPALAPALSVVAFGVAQCCLFETSLARKTCHVLLLSYGMLLLFPSFG